MRKSITNSICVVLLVSMGSCSTGRMATGDTGATLAGAIIGSNVGGAIGGLIGESGRGGRHGAFRGSAIGTITGAIAGAAIGNAVSAANQPKAEVEYRPAEVSSAHVEALSPMENLKIHNIRFIDDSRDHVISPEESSKVIFEIMNEGDTPVFDVVPVVAEMSGTRHLNISPSLMVEEIPPRHGIKYTATITASRYIKDGEAIIRVAVSDVNGKEYDWKEFTIPTGR